MILDPVSGFAFAAGIIVALISTQPVRLAAFRWGILDRPSTSIKTHEGAVPTLGGVPIFLGTLAAILTVLLLGGLDLDLELIALVGGGALVMFLGLADDIKGFVRGHLSAYAYPRRIEFVSELPKTSSGKIRRIELREQEQAQFGE